MSVWPCSCELVNWFLLLSMSEILYFATICTLPDCLLKTSTSCDLWKACCWLELCGALVNWNFVMFLFSHHLILKWWSLEKLIKKYIELALNKYLTIILMEHSGSNPYLLQRENSKAMQNLILCFFSVEQ